MKIKAIGVIIVVYSACFLVFSCGPNNKALDCEGSYTGQAACIETAFAGADANSKTLLITALDKQKTDCEVLNGKKDTSTEESWAKAEKIITCLTNLSQCTVANTTIKIKACSVTDP